MYMYMYIYIYIYLEPYIYIVILYAFRRHLNFSYMSILTNLLWTDNETKSVKTIYKQIS